MIKIFKNINRILYYINFPILGIIFILMGIILFKILIEIGYNTYFIYFHIFFITWSILVYYFNITLRKTIDFWKIADMIAFVFSFPLIIILIRMLPNLSGFYVYSISIIILFLILIVTLVINLFLYNKFLALISVVSFAYGIINDSMYNVLLALITYIMGSLDIDEIKEYFKLAIFDEKKFIRDKYLIMVAISCTAIANVLGEPILKYIFRKFELCFYNYSFESIIYRGVFRVIFSSLFFVILVKLYKRYQHKLINRYTTNERDENLKADLS